MAEGSTTFTSAGDVSRATEISQTATTPSNNPSQSGDNLFTGVVPNPLKEYASYNYLFSIACLTPDQANNPESYRTGDAILDYVILSEGGRQNDQRVNTYYGSPELFINNVEFMCLTGTGGLEPVANFKFDIYEAYSMGLFLQMLQVAAIKAGWANVTDAKYVLKLQYNGWDKNGVNKLIPYATRYIPMTFSEVNFTYTDNGTLYKVKGVPLGQEVFNNVNNSLKNTVSPAGKTVEEVLGGKDPQDGSLGFILDKMYEELKDKGVIGEADTFGIYCAKSISEGEVSERWDELADSSFNYSEYTGSRSFASDAERVKAQEKSRDAVNSGEKKQKAFQFTVGSGDDERGVRTITSCIREVVLNSDYCTKAFENIQNGQIDWFIIHSGVYEKKELFDRVRGRYAKIFKFFVMPFKVNASKVKNPLSPAQGLDRSIVKKKYDYLYTGQNDDIITWNINLDNTYYQSIFAGIPENTSGANAAASPTEAQTAVVRQNLQGDGSLAAGVVGSAPQQLDPQAAPAPQGGAAADSPEILVARQMQRNLIDTYDQLSATLEIYGDPYFFSDAGYGNYFPPSEGDGINSDGAATFNSGEVRIFVGFKTPSDAPRNGQYLYPFKSSNYSPFSGLFKIWKVYSIFKDGLFTNRLHLTRDKGQTDDAINAARTDPALGGSGGAVQTVGKTDGTTTTVPTGDGASGSSAPGSSAVSSRVAPLGTVTSSSLPAGVR